MAFGFQVPRQRQRPLTQGAQIAEDQNTRGLATGQFGDVQSAAGATDRANALRTSNALQATRGTFARAGVDTSPEAASRAQDQSFSAAEGQNLNGTNAVNQLQRQYRNDAVTNANQYESAANQRQQQGISNEQFDKTYSANREDAQTARNQFGQNYQAGREDAQTARNQFGETMSQRKNEFGQTSGQSQQQIDNQSRQFLLSQAQRDKEFGTTSGQNQQQINNQSSQFDRNLNQDKSQFDLSRGDKNAQFGVTSGQNQQQIDAQKNQFDRNYESGREDAADSRNRFDLTRGDTNSQFNAKLGQDANQFRITSGQNQQQIDNQASQAAAKMGYDYRSLDQNAQQFFQKMAQEDSQFVSKTNYDYNALNQNDRQFDKKYNQDESQFGVTSGQNQQQINNQSSQFNEKLNQDQEQFQSKQSLDNRQFGITSGQNQQQIDAQKNQFDITRGDSTKNSILDEINSISDPRARNLALKTYYEGGNVRDAISGNIDSTGQLINRQDSPGVAAFNAKVDELQQTYPDKTPEQIRKMVQDRDARNDTITDSVGGAEAKKLTVEKSLDTLSRLKPGEAPAQADLDNLPSVNAAAIPIGAENVGPWLKTNTTGGWTKINGTPYKVVSGDKWLTKGEGMFTDAKYEAYTTLKDADGKTWYRNQDGKITNLKPGTIRA